MVGTSIQMNMNYGLELLFRTFGACPANKKRRDIRYLYEEAEMIFRNEGGTAMINRPCFMAGAIF